MPVGDKDVVSYSVFWHYMICGDIFGDYRDNCNLCHVLETSPGLKWIRTEISD